ncbi:hypothetical protein DVQ78_21015 [Yersinia enterocolitica]|nr:hypothetical protein [Yersinia enterocolitica]
MATIFREYETQSIGMGSVFSLLSLSAINITRAGKHEAGGANSEYSPGDYRVDEANHVLYPDESGATLKMINVFGINVQGHQANQSGGDFFHGTDFDYGLFE